MFITGPEVVRTVTGEEVSFEELGGADTHAQRSGVAHFVADDEQALIDDARYLLSFLPQNNLDPAARRRRPTRSTGADAELDSIVPDSPTQPYDMTAVIRRIVDDGDFFEMHEDWAQQHRVRLRAARRPRRSASSATSRSVLAGVLDIDSSVKAARFVRTCDAFGIPIVTFVDVPGFLPGTAQEWGGIIRHGAKLLYAYCEATVPKLAVITRKAYGGAYDVMSSKHIRADFNFAWPTAEVAVMGPEGAVNIVFRKELAAADDAEARRAELIDDYKEQVRQPVHGGRARLRRRRDPPVGDAAACCARRSRSSRTQARRAPEAPPRQHPAVSRARRLRTLRDRRPSPPRRSAPRSSRRSSGSREDGRGAGAVGGARPSRGCRRRPRLIVCSAAASTRPSGSGAAASAPGRRHVERMQASARALGLPVPGEDAILAAIARRGRRRRRPGHPARRRGCPSSRPRAASRLGRPGAPDLASRLVRARLRAARAQADEPLPRRARPCARRRARRRRRAARRAVERARRRGDERERLRADRRGAVTPPVDGAAARRHARAHASSCSRASACRSRSAPLALDELARARGVLLTTSVRGLVPALSLDGSALARPPPSCSPRSREALDRAETAELLALPLP